MSRMNQKQGTAPEVDAARLERRLKRNLEGEVRFGTGDRALYATDASNYRQMPIGVVVPKRVEDVLETVAQCREFGAPLLSRGGGTSLAGQCCNTAVVMDFSKYLNKVLEIDPKRRLARVQPGCVLDILQREAQKHGLVFGPDPATHSHCCLGGMLGNNSCGIHSLISANAGLGMRVSDNTHELEVLTYPGLRLRVGAVSPERLNELLAEPGPRAALYRQLHALQTQYGDQVRSQFPRLPRRVSGYNLDDLLPEKGFHVARSLVGTESTCVTILEATLHLVESPPARSLLVLGYPDVFQAADHLMEILEFAPTGLEGLDHALFKFVKEKGDKPAHIALLPPGRAWLLVEFGGESREEANEQGRRCMQKLSQAPEPPSMRLMDQPEEKEMVWEIRESGLASTAWVKGMPDFWPGFEDSAVPPERMADYLRAFRQLLDRYDYHPSLYGHFGQGCLHCRIDFDLYTKPGLSKYRDFMKDATEVVIAHGGVLSGEHGDGQARGEFLERVYGQDLMEAFRKFKQIWDPHGKMNPGKVIDAYGITDNLRLGTDYHPPMPETHFHFPEDKYSFARAALRCVGVGECRKHGEQTMCPSYMVTLEEKHSTRGRARLLWEMLNGGLRHQGWRSKAVKESLDLCLACKGCKDDCPVNVDMATYKAEFFSHYYQGRLRPRHAYAFGFIHQWARLASLAPRLVNWFSRNPIFGPAGKFLAGVAQKRSVPQFAPVTFKDWFKQRPLRSLEKSRVVLWPDTFNNYFHPQVAMAAVEVLEAMNFQVVVPQKDMCCGRPLYDFGFLDTAKRWLRQILEIMREEIRAGTPVVVLEPSCAAVFRDELINLFPHDEDAKRLQSQTYLLGEFITQKAPSFAWPEWPVETLVHIHCHHKAVMGDEPECQLLDQLGVNFKVLDSGCCGMAGAFGFEAGESYEVSIQCGERVLLPAVRQAGREVTILTSGFSCHEQIAQQTGRQAVHLAEFLKRALKEGRPKQGAPARHSPPRRVGREKVEDSSPPENHRYSPWLLAGAGIAAFLVWMSRNFPDDTRGS